MQIIDEPPRIQTAVRGVVKSQDMPHVSSQCDSVGQEIFQAAPIVADEKGIHVVLFRIQRESSKPVGEKRNEFAFGPEMIQAFHLVEVSVHIQFGVVPFRVEEIKDKFDTGTPVEIVADGSA